MSCSIVIAMSSKVWQIGEVCQCVWCQNGFLGSILYHVMVFFFQNVGFSSVRVIMESVINEAILSLFPFLGIAQIVQ